MAHRGLGGRTHRVAGDEDEAAGQFGRSLLKGAIQLKAVHAGHFHIAQNQIKRLLRDGFERRFATVDDANRMPQISQQALNYFGHAIFVVHHQNAVRSPILNIWPRPIIGDQQIAITDCNRQHQVKRCAFIGNAVHPDFAAVVVQNVVANRQTQPGAFADRLGGEKRIEDASQQMFGNAWAGVADVDRDFVANPFSNHAQNAAATFGHRLMRVADQIEKHLLQLIRIGDGGR